MPRNRHRSAARLGWLLPACLGLGFGPAPRAAEGPSPFTPEVGSFVRSYKPGGQDLRGEVNVLPAEESRRRLQLADGLVVDLIAQEPGIRQPLELQVDERGRLWVVEYRQYPYPAGLTITGYDQYLRAGYDRVPPPPPHHTRGADRITILEDRDGDGTFETQRTFLDGLNLATSVLPGAGGVWVLHSPYLLFYPDRDGDDVPDGDPEVHLSGFGIEDTHSLATSLHWGPDGWIYGAKGSTTTLDIQGQRLLGQCIWRYDPRTKVFEIFAEGGGNTFSCEFDREGRLFSGTNTGGTRGLHYQQGATYAKGWTKHGPAMNPFIFGFLEHMEHQGYGARFPQAFLLYDAPRMPGLQGQIVTGMALTNRVQASRLVADGSTFRTEDTVTVANSDDRAFRPVDIEQGLDGAIYLTDWADARLSHLNPLDTWDKSSGRIFRIRPAGDAAVAPINLRAESTARLLERLSDPNRMIREQARRLLWARPEPIAATLRARLEAGGADALEALWVLNGRGEWDEAQARGALRHRNPHVRRWSARLLGDRRRVEAPTLELLVALARGERDPEVRAQLASSARRLSPAQAIPLVRALLGRDEDAADKHLPLLLWWALEAQAEAGREEILALVQDPASWRSQVFRQHLAERLGRRYTADQGPGRSVTLKEGAYSEWIIERESRHLARNLAFCARLLEAALGRPEARLLLAGMARGLTGRPVEEVPAAFGSAVEGLWREEDRSAGLASLAARLRLPGAEEAVVARLVQPGLSESEQKDLLDFVAVAAPRAAESVVAAAFRREKAESRRARLLVALGAYPGEAAAAAVLEAYPGLPPRLQSSALRMLCERPAWARLLLAEALPGKVATTIGGANAERIRAHGDPALSRSLEQVLRREGDDPSARTALQLFEGGKAAYALSCASCHQEAGEGRNGLAPALVGSRWLQVDDTLLVRIVLHGKENPGRGLVMPPWRQLEDGQLAAILTFVRREFGNQARAVLPATVAQVRAATADRVRPWSDAELDALRGAR